jgi:hypothetical protein
MIPDIIDGNTSIAKYMGYTYYPFVPGSNVRPGWKTHEGASEFSKFNSASMGIRPFLCRSKIHLGFHRDWLDLMWVLERLQKNGCTIKLDMNFTKEDPQEKVFSCSIERIGKRDIKTFVASKRNLIRAVWLAVVSFIQDYEKVDA